MNKEIYQLLFVVFAGVAAAFLTLGFMIYSWSPSGSYLAKNVLLMPDVAKQISYQNLDHETGEKTKIIFDNIEFTYLDRKIEISPEKYGKFYALVEKDRSLEPGKEVEASFTAFLYLNVKEKRAQVSTHFQEIAFAGDYYRVELHQEKSEFAYFYHPQIYNQVMRLFTSG